MQDRKMKRPGKSSVERAADSVPHRSERKLALVIRLRQQIAAIERRPLDDKQDGAETASGFPTASFKPAPAGVLHEIWTDQERNAGPVLGFALGQARALLNRQRSAILWVQLAHEARETGLPYGPGLRSFGIDPETLVICRVHTVMELLWAVEEAAGCRAVAAVIADVVHSSKALDFTASRRLNMRADAAKISIFMVRYGTGREASAAGLRWRVTPHLSGVAPFDPRAPGIPRFGVVLEKGEARMGLKPGAGNWILDWTDDGFSLDTKQWAGTGPREGGPTAHSGAPFAALGHRLPQTA